MLLEEKIFNFSYHKWTICITYVACDMLYLKGVITRNLEELRINVIFNVLVFPVLLSFFLIQDQRKNVTIMKALLMVSHQVVQVGG